VSRNRKDLHIKRKGEERSYMVKMRKKRKKRDRSPRTAHGDRITMRWNCCRGDSCRRAPARTRDFVRKVGTLGSK